MEMQSVNSSQIAQVGHDGQTKLQVLFRRGGLYEYDNVTAAEFREMMTAESLGSYFYKAIKGAKPFTKVEGTEWPAKVAEPEVMAKVEAPAAENQNQEVEQVGRKAELLVSSATSIKVIDPTTQQQASALLLGIAGIRKEIADTFKPMKDAAFRAHKVVCEQERKLDEPLANAERAVKGQIGSFVQEQQRIAREHEERLRREEQERAELAAKAESQALAIADAVQLEAQGDIAGAEAVLNNPAPAPVRYVAPAPVAAQVAQVQGVSMREDWNFRIVDESKIPREYMLVNESAIRNLGKTTKGKAKIAGVEFYPKQVVSASRRG